jgi:replicative DNA helicase
MNAPLNRTEAEGLEVLAAPPASIEAEQCVLGGLMLDNRAYDLVAGRLRESDFYRSDHRTIWRAVVRLIERGQPADVVTVFDALNAEKKAEEVGGLVYLNALATNTPSAANIRSYAKIVADRAVLRGLIQVGQQAIDAAVSRRGRDVGDIVHDIEAAVSGLVENGLNGDEDLPSLGETLVAVRDEIQQRIEAPDQFSGLATGLRDVDAALDGLQRNDLVIVGGRSSMGKTSFSMQLGQNVALKGGSVLTFSMEMSAIQLVRRMLSNLARVPADAIRCGRLDDAQMERLADAQDRLSAAKFEIDDRPALTVGQMRARARRVKRKQGLDLIIVDYLQLGRATAENRTQEVSEISRGLKALAKEMRVPVIALSQLSRGVEARSDKRPMMSDLRESGAIEQDADVIIFCYRDEVYNPDTADRGVMELGIAKQRNGATGRVCVAWQAEFTRIEDLAVGYEPAVPRSKPSRNFRETD